ncbi:MAG: hypothetical protein RR139_02685 [Lachnospiraceae bacterium]
MKRLVGFALFFIAIGMLLMIIVHNQILGFLLVFLLMLLGYNLFCS